MKLYHGTSETVARLALTEGLTPRGWRDGESTWKDLPSSPDVVYLTTAYAGYFALNATPEKERWGIIEIDSDRLFDEDMVPDEDFMEQVTRGHTMENWDLPAAGMPGRTKWFSDRLTAFHPCWTDSLAGLGNCGYANSIPAEAITRVGLYDPASNPTMTMMAMDPTITIMNYRICKAKYQALVAWLMGDKVDPLAFSFFAHADLRELDPSTALLQARERFISIISDKSGREVLSGLGLSC